MRLLWSYCFVFSNCSLLVVLTVSEGSNRLKDSGILHCIQNGKNDVVGQSNMVRQRTGKKDIYSVLNVFVDHVLARIDCI